MCLKTCHGVHNDDYHLCRGFITVNRYWVEGFIIDNHLSTDNNEIGFIYGVYLPNNAMELFLCCNNTVTRIHAEFDESKYIGTLSTSNFSMANYGKCTISISNQTDYTSAEINNKGNICKSLMDYQCKNFYNEIFKHRDDLILLLNYNISDNWTISDILGNNYLLSRRYKVYGKKYEPVTNNENKYNWRI